MAWWLWGALIGAGAGLMLSGRLIRLFDDGMVKKRDAADSAEMARIDTLARYARPAIAGAIVLEMIVIGAIAGWALAKI